MAGMTKQSIKQIRNQLEGKCAQAANKKIRLLILHPLQAAHRRVAAVHRHLLQTLQSS